MTGYYQPYWLQSNELEHYGIKGMKWGKKKNPYELVKTDFNNLKVGETIDYIVAKDKYDTLAYGPWIDTNAKKINMTRVRKTIKSTGSKNCQVSKLRTCFSWKESYKQYPR